MVDRRFAWGIAILVLVGLAFAVSRYSYVAFHFYVESLSMAVAFSAFAVAHFSRRFIGTNGLWLIGTSYLFVGVMGAFHTLTYKGMGPFGLDPNIATQYWIAGRGIETAALLVGLLLVDRRFSPVLSLGLMAGATLLLAVLVQTGYFPDCFKAGSGLTPFKVGMEYLYAALYGVAALLLRLRRPVMDEAIARLLFRAVLFQFAAELSFTLYTDVYGVTNFAGHIFRLAAFVYVFRALVQQGLERPQALIAGMMAAERHQAAVVEEKGRRLAAALREAERASAAKSRFLAAASHDLRQPLQAMRLFLETLNVRLGQTEHQPIIDKVFAAHDSAGELLNSLLDLSTLEAGTVKVEKAEIPVGTILQQCYLECVSAAQQKGLALRLVPSSAMVCTDPTLLLRMLRNLATNAIKYTPQGKVLIGCRRVGDQLRIEVWDTGVGIDADQLDLVFEEFFQVGNSERNREKGLGLGLSVVKKTAQLLGHQVELRSVPGRGSVFAIIIEQPSAAARLGRDDPGHDRLDGGMKARMHA